MGGFGESFVSGARRLSMNELSTAKTQTPAARRSYKWLLWLGLVVALVAALRYSHAKSYLQEGLQLISTTGLVGMLCYVLLYIVVCVLMLPGSVLTIGAGTVFGLGTGILLTSVGSTLGATAAFLVGRYLTRDWIARRIERHPRFRAIDRAVAREGWKIVGLTRLSPVFPFSLLNYAYGLTSVSLRDYFFASWIGMLPMTVLYVYVGSLLRNATTADPSSGRVRSPLEWGMYGLGLLATVVVSVYVTRLARRALRERVDDVGGSKPV